MRVVHILLACMVLHAGIAHAADRVRIKVIDFSTRAPLPGTWLIANMGGDLDESETNPQGVGEIFFTNRNGRAVPLRIERDGYVPMRISLNGANPNMPEELTFEMFKAAVVGGIVNDENGKGIEGVTVSVRAVLREPSKVTPAGFVPQLAGMDVKTDASGKWTCDGTAAESENVELRFVHPSFIADVITVPRDEAMGSALRTMSAEKVLSHGVTIAGRILDGAGKPIADATITRSGGDEGARNYPNFKSDASGVFAAAHCEPGATQLVVRAGGFAAQGLTIPKEGAPQSLEFKLVPTREMRATITDPAGKPLAGAAVAIAPLRDSRTIPFRANTNEQGLIVWPEAPADEEMRATITKSGFMTMRRSIRAGEPAQPIALAPTIIVRGLVLDDQSGAPIESFSTMPGTKTGTRAIAWQRGVAQKSPDGRFEISLTQMGDEHYLRVEVPGYKPMVSRTIASGESGVNLEFRLEKAGNVDSPSSKAD